MEEIYMLLADIRPEHNYHESEDFIVDGLLDSFDIIMLIDMLEEKYSISIDPLEIVPENFANVNAIYALVEKTSGGKK